MRPSQHDRGDRRATAAVLRDLDGIGVTLFAGSLHDRPAPRR
jgi:hypothetical protein